MVLAEEKLDGDQRDNGSNRRRRTGNGTDRRQFDEREQHDHGPETARAEIIQHVAYADLVLP